MVTQADTLGVFGKSADGRWYKICCVNGGEAWIASQFAVLSGDTAAIAVAAPPALTDETQADDAVAVAGGGGGGGGGTPGRISIGNVVPAVDNPPPGKILRTCVACGSTGPCARSRRQRPVLTGSTNPLTGLPIDPARLQERIFVARYGNEPAVNDYFGISAPDLVFEELMDRPQHHSLHHGLAGRRCAADRSAALLPQHHHPGGADVRCAHGQQRRGRPQPGLCLPGRHRGPGRALLLRGPTSTTPTAAAIRTGC